MSKLRRTLALLATLAVASTAFVACGGSESSSTTDSNSSSQAANDSSEEGGDSSEEGGDSSEEGGNDSSDAPAEAADPDDVVDIAAVEISTDGVTQDSSDDTLTIVCWNDNDLAPMFEVYKKTYPDANLKYQNVGTSGGEAATEYNTYLASGADIDLYVAEAGWILNYINKDEFSAPLANLGISESDFSNAYQYTVDIGTDNNGVLKGASWQAAAGGYVYNADLAEQYLGVTSPEDMQAKIGDWDGFEATAAELKEASNGAVTMAATVGGLWQCFSTATNSPWVNGTTINTDTAREFTEMVKGYAENGYVDPSIGQWTEAWTNEGVNGDTMGYFYSTWCLGSTAQLYQNGGTDWNWKIVEGPQNYFWGGSWLCLHPSCNTGEEAARFVKYFTSNTESMEYYALFSGDFVNNKAAMKDIVDNKYNANPLLGGQDQFAVLTSVADGIKMNDSISAYDQSLKDTFINTLTDNIDSDVDTIISTFTSQAVADNPDLNA